MQLIADNRKFSRKATVTLSTVKLPCTLPRELGGWMYESCLFTESGSEVLDRYVTMEAAVEGHKDLAFKYGLAT